MMVDRDPMRQTSFGDENSAELLALPTCRDDALVDEGSQAPKPCLLPVEIRDVNTHQWLTVRRRSLYNDEDYLSPTASSSELRPDLR